MTNTLRVTIFGANLGDIERELHVQAAAYFGDVVPYKVVEIDATGVARSPGSVLHWTANCIVVEDT